MMDLLPREEPAARRDADAQRAVATATWAVEDALVAVAAVALGAARAVRALDSAPAASIVEAATLAENASSAAAKAAVAVRDRGATNMAQTMWAVGAGERALQAAERAFVLLADRVEVRAGAGVLRPPGELMRRLLVAASVLLPAADRARYTEEWLSLLTELPTRRAWGGNMLSIVRGAPGQAWTLRRSAPAPGRRPGR
ncbi:hypothetical protein [Actinomadura luteofluorescens]|uniref:hypothetical protein n=1 Tax=Actinomadura luteofluorescens TaxID=46163 RepID=UPI0030CF9AD7